MHLKHRDAGSQRQRLESRFVTMVPVAYEAHVQLHLWVGQPHILHYGSDLGLDSRDVAPLRTSNPP